VAVDGSGNVALTGTFYGTVDFGGAPLTAVGSSDVFVASFTSGGAHRWSKGFGGTSLDYGYGVAADAAGNVTLTGSFYTSIDFGGGPLTAASSSSDLFLASFTPTGQHRWSRAHGASGSEVGRAVAADAGGGVYATGYFGATVDFGGGPVTAVGSSDVFLLRLAAP
jgi:hypothetical protein